ncbi:unnamed protein product [Brassica rapa]|uniref:Uncharacterized protein n=1 Tax=Brassica campestris TaxID=3711 RepID=A0A3P6BT04_BRACM|nr:unnamed protein product [Brassica rapa]VDC98928.1 unnamed protein product [Brassica rapa]
MFIWNQGPSFLPMQGIGRSVERFDVRTTALHTLYQEETWRGGYTIFSPDLNGGQTNSKSRGRVRWLETK